MSTSLHIEAIPILDNNYVWALHDQKHVVLVDPGRAEAPLDWISDRSLQLTGLLITHHHWDHTDGIDPILARHPVPVYGPVDERIPQVTHPIKADQQFHIPEPAIDLKALSVPGHTSIHLAYLGQGFVLCGDALFSAGCGRMFEGTPEQMQASLDQFAALPGDTKMYCAHEYTLDNCRFALQVEPDNEALIDRFEEVLALRRKGTITLPSTMGRERDFNPFLRTREPSVILAAQRHSPDSGQRPDQVFATLRRWKDQG